jgi:hypothetical protein
MKKERSMQRTYHIMPVSPSSFDWSEIPAASIDAAPWHPGALLPPSQVQMAFDGNAFLVRWTAWETSLRVVTREHNGPVWEDSCMEFFFNPVPQRDRRYLNFEVNAEGYLLLGLGASRHGRVLPEGFDPSLFPIRCDVPKHGASTWDRPFYTVGITIPVSFLESIYGKLELHSGAELAGNFQKCKGLSHMGCWNPIKVPTPDFHQPDWFGTLLML